MSKPFDASTKDLIWNHPKDWLDFLGFPARNVTVGDSDLSTVTGAADKILIVDADPPYAAHLELQSNYKVDDDERFALYNVLAGRQTGLPVRTVVFLLRPDADGPGMRRDFQRRFPDEPPYLQFRFRVVRVWEQPVEAFLMGGIGLLPLVPLCNVSPDALPDLIRQMEYRIEAEAPNEAGILWSETYILMGLRFRRELADHLLRGVRDMKESDTYQAILDEGKVEGKREEAKATLLRLGEKRFGALEEATRTRLEQIVDLSLLEQLTDRLLEVESWTELLSGV